jgi:hypothetical protein
MGVTSRSLGQKSDRGTAFKSYPRQHGGPNQSAWAAGECRGTIDMSPALDVAPTSRAASACSPLPAPMRFYLLSSLALTFCGVRPYFVLLTRLASLR